MINGQFISYQEKYKGYSFYFLNLSPIITKTDNAKFLESNKVSRSIEKQDVNIQETKINLSILVNIIFHSFFIYCPNNY